MLEALLVITLVNTGALAFLLFGGERWRLKKLPTEKSEAGDRPFTVVLATPSGAAARDVFLAQPLKDGETVEFCENGVRRGLR